MFEDIDQEGGGREVMKAWTLGMGFISGSEFLFKFILHQPITIKKQLSRQPINSTNDDIHYHSVFLAESRIQIAHFA